MLTTDRKYGLLLILIFANSHYVKRKRKSDQNGVLGMQAGELLQQKK